MICFMSSFHKTPISIDNIQHKLNIQVNGESLVRNETFNKFVTSNGSFMNTKTILFALMEK